jgi:hypothetical protein
MPHISRYGWAVNQGWGDGWAKHPNHFLWVRTASAGQAIPHVTTRPFGFLSGVVVESSGGLSFNVTTGQIRNTEEVVYFSIDCQSAFAPSGTGGFGRVYAAVVHGTPDAFGPNIGDHFFPSLEDGSTRDASAAMTKRLSTGIVPAPYDSGLGYGATVVNFENQYGVSITLSGSHSSYLLVRGWNLS